MNFFCCSCVGFHQLSSCLVRRESSCRDAPCFFSNHGRNWSRLSLQPQCGLSPQTWECSTVPCKTPGAWFRRAARGGTGPHSTNNAALLQYRLSQRPRDCNYLCFMKNCKGPTSQWSREGLLEPFGCSFVGHHAENEH